MNFVCDNCGAQYFVDDRKVAGKTVHVRCKKCTHVIRVQGRGASSAVAVGTGSHPPASRSVQAAPPPRPARPPEWHYAVKGRSFGPFDEDDLVAKFLSGQLGDDTYVWTAAQGDWRPAYDLAKFAPGLAEARRLNPPMDALNVAPNPTRPQTKKARPQPPAAAQASSLAQAKATAVVTTPPPEPASASTTAASSPAASPSVSAAEPSSTDSHRATAQLSAGAATTRPTTTEEQPAARAPATGPPRPLLPDLHESPEPQPAAFERRDVSGSQRRLTRSGATEAAPDASLDRLRSLRERLLGASAQWPAASPTESGGPRIAAEAPPATAQTVAPGPVDPHRAKTRVGPAPPFHESRAESAPTSERVREGEAPLREPTLASTHSAQWGLESAEGTRSTLNTQDFDALRVTEGGHPYIHEVVTSIAPPPPETLAELGRHALGEDDEDGLDGAPAERPTDRVHDEAPLASDATEVPEELATDADEGEDGDESDLAEAAAEALPGADEVAEAGALAVGATDDENAAAADETEDDAGEDDETELDDDEDDDENDAAREPAPPLEASREMARVEEAFFATAAPAHVDDLSDLSPLAAPHVPNIDAAARAELRRLEKKGRTGRLLGLGAIAAFGLAAVLVLPPLLEDPARRALPDFPESVESLPGSTEPGTTLPVVDEDVVRLNGMAAVNLASSETHRAVLRSFNQSVRAAEGRAEGSEPSVVVVGVAEPGPEEIDSARRPQRDQTERATSEGTGGNSVFSRLHGRTVNIEREPTAVELEAAQPREHSSRLPPDYFAQDYESVRRAVQRCHELQLRENTALPFVRVVLELTVQPDGAVGIGLDPELADSTFGRCLQTRYAAWRFRSFEGAAVTLQRTYSLQ